MPGHRSPGRIHKHPLGHCLSIAASALVLVVAGLDLLMVYLVVLLLVLFYSFVSMVWVHRHRPDKRHWTR
jgi:hypothetical protein